MAETTFVLTEHEYGEKQPTTICVQSARMFSIHSRITPLIPLFFINKIRHLSQTLSSAFAMKEVRYDITCKIGSLSLFIVESKNCDPDWFLHKNSWSFILLYKVLHFVWLEI